ncbi:Non-specific serine/threonine protein kinase [Mycena venus]|uniref:Non-specific serine/threonine protein kinase n=1 Tax=Mycena venus TaxID=2733690 RepID=A0A8H6XQS8_9AGAR|nr:Non-specific serine/threonine protein kinase [Mycena venus]
MSLQIPSPSRPVSAAVQPTSPPSARRQPQNHRASHQVVSSTDQQQPPAPAYTDVYSHPAAVARTIPKFGPYLLLQTLGEGEFGKVKLGLHSQWGEEVAVKLIRRGNVDSAVRMSKVEREIEVLRTLKHPNIVRLYDVIETDKYIGIIIEYASGGELFDHILAHRYLRERDASKLFSTSTKKKIVHRDLKLENLLLDRHRNVIITDFGFANRFEHRADDLMQTSCGSPCYAAPELVISEGLYVGSAVDIWSCGVILYAMLAGYLPFDDDPANPDGDNINLLYKYIVNTPLSFPEYVSEEARGLLKMMLVPDPRRRASLEDVMRHPWLAAYHAQRPEEDEEEGMPVAFGKTVEELERAAMEQHQLKRLAYQRQMRNASAPAATTSQLTRAQTQTQSQGQSQNQPQHPQRSHSTAPGQPELFYNSADGSGAYGDDDDPFGPVPGPGAGRRGKEREVDPKDKFRHTIQVEYDDRRGQRARAGSTGATGGREKERERASPVQERRERERSRTPTQAQSTTPTQTPTRGVPPSPVPVVPSVPTTPSSASASAVNGTGTEKTGPTTTSSPSATSVSERRERRRQGSASSSVGATGKPLPPSPTATSPPTTWKRMHEKSVVGPGEMINGSGEKERPAVMDVFSGEKEGGDAEKEKEGEKAQEKKEKEKETEEKERKERKEKEGKKSRRNTLTGLTVMVNPINSIRVGIGRSRQREPSTTTSTSPPAQLAPPAVQAAPHTGSADKTFADDRDASGGGMKASTSKARKVMQWIRKGRDSLTVAAPTAQGVPSPAESTTSGDTGDASATSPVQVYVTTPTTNSSAAAAGMGAPLSPIVTKTLAGGRKPSDAASPVSTSPAGTTPTASVSESFASRFRRSVNIVGGGSSGGSIKGRGERDAAATAAGTHQQLRIHHGAVDQGTITTGQPPEVMRHVKEVLAGMGVEIFVESDYKYRCIRAKQRRGGKSTVGSTGGAGAQGGVAAFTMAGSAASNGVDKRGLPLPSQSSFSGGGMLRGLLMRRQSSQVSTGAAPGSTSFDGDDSLNASGILSAEPAGQADTVYGEALEDAGDEVRFSVELTRLNLLNDTYSLDIRRLKGNLRSYKFLYDTLRKRADLQR